MGEGTIYTEKVFDAVTIAASGSSTTDAIDLGAKRPGGKYSIQIVMTGSGTAKLEWLGSNDGSTFSVPVTLSEVFTGFTAGNAIYTYAPILTRYIKLKATETGTSDSVTITATLMVQ